MTGAVQDLLAEAHGLQETGDYEAAILLLDRASRVSPNHRPWFALAGRLVKAGLYERASWCFSRGLEDDPKTNELDKKMVATARHFPQRRRIARIIARNLAAIRKDASRMKSHRGSDFRFFVYWNSGFEHAPPVARRCHTELKRLLGSKLVTLDEKSWPFYVAIPQVVIDKVPADKAHFSDILRVALLAQYGGAWADATCLPGQDFEGFARRVASNGFFAYERGDDGGISSWFMCSAGSNYIPKMLFAALCRYWSRYDKLTHYFMLHHIFEALYHLDEQFAQIWNARVRKSANPPHYLQRSMFNPFADDHFSELYAGASVHKLTYKFRGKVPTPDLFVSHIVRGDFPKGESPPLTGTKLKKQSFSFWPFRRERG